jgi:outer membrane lipoprotein-sorting protein
MTEGRDDADPRHGNRARHGAYVTIICMAHCRSDMRVRIGLAAMSGVFVVHVAAQTGPSDRSFESLFERGRQLNSELKTLTARFTETTTSGLLTRALVATGTVAVERPSRVVLHYEEPERRDVLIDGDRLTISWPSRGIRDVTNIATTNRRIQRYFVDATPERLRDNFTITIGKESGRPHTYLVTMVPKRKQIREGLTSLDLWIDDSSLLLSAMKMTFPNGDTKLMVLDHVVANAPIDQAVFTAAK